MLHSIESQMRAAVMNGEVGDMTGCTRPRSMHACEPYLILKFGCLRKWCIDPHMMKNACMALTHHLSFPDRQQSMSTHTRLPCGPRRTLVCAYVYVAKRMHVGEEACTHGHAWRRHLSLSGCMPSTRRRKQTACTSPCAKHARLAVQDLSSGSANSIATAGCMSL